ncbi:MAG: RDD family protein, partial [Dokdonella sp.]
MSSSMPASLSLRIAAGLYDLFPLIALWMLSAGLALLIVHGRIDVAHPPTLFRFGLRAALLVVSAAYFVISWARGGQTIGMRAWRLRVVAADGNALPWPRALLRFSIALVSLSVCAIGFLWCLIDPGRRAWHDLGARSAVIRTRSL